MSESCFDKIQIKYQGFHRSKTTDEEKTNITYIGSYELCKEAYDEAHCMTSHPEYGTLEEARLEPDDGTFWNLELTYAIDLGGNAKSSKGSRLGPKNSSLTVRMLGNPLEMHKNYKKKWNYNLYTTLPPTLNAKTMIDHRVAGTWDKLMNDADARHDEIPTELKVSSWDHKKDLRESSNFVIAWGKYLNDLPQLYGEDGTQYEWTECASMTKPGVEYYNYPVYELTEGCSSRSQSDCAWVVADAVGKIATPNNGDFDIVKNFGGNWLCTGADVSYEKPYWNAKMTYTRSADVSMSDIPTNDNKGTVWNEGRYTKDKVKTFLWDPEIYEKSGSYSQKRNLVPKYDPSGNRYDPDDRPGN